MTESRHTPGPWVVCVSSDGRPYIHETDAVGPILAKTYRDSFRHGPLPAEANAALIAAAPETAAERDRLKEENAALVEAIRECLGAINPPERGGISMYVWNGRLKNASTKARAVLAKVKP